MNSLREFSKERDWDQFHTPKNLSMALTVEASELLEQFQWLTPEQSDELKDISADKLKRQAITEEIADVLLYAFRLADVMNVDLDKAINEKIAKNALKYPVGKSKGLATKYTDLK
jgi:dCTP diphosphatase